MKKYGDLLICMFLAAAILAAYWQVQYYDLTCYDDISYISNNPYVKKGLTGESFTWAMTTIHMGYWQPLTWLSHMLDYQLFGPNIGGHHWVNVILHIANAILLYIVLRRTSGETWKSAIVAALFAVHPLNVESVAWIAERKNVLSTLFWFIALWFYACYVERPTLYRYALILLTFSLGLMAKPMLVTLPFTLLLFDYWPLGRLTSWKVLPRLLYEKIPFFILTTIVSIETFLSCRHKDVISHLDKITLGERTANVLVSYVKYIANMLWPQDLAIFYPYSKDFTAFQIVGSALLLIITSCIMIIFARQYRYALTGWLWYLGTLIPVIGLIQAGPQAMADRFAYIPMIGLFVMIVWGVPDLLKKWPQRRIVFSVVSGAVLSVLIICTLQQVRYWQNSMALFEHALRVTGETPRVHYHMGVALTHGGKPDQAVKHFEYAIKGNPEFAEAYSYMGIALASQGKIDGAMAYFREALQRKRHDEMTHNNLGAALINKGKLDEAIVHIQEALNIRPDYVPAHRNMGVALASQGKMEEAIGYYKKALQLERSDAITHNNIGIALAYTGRREEAVHHFREALKINPYYGDAADNLRTIQKSVKDH